MPVLTQYLNPKMQVHESKIWTSQAAAAAINASVPFASSYIERRGI